MSDNLYLFANNNGEQAEGNGSYRLYDMQIEGDSPLNEEGVTYIPYLESTGTQYIDTGLISTNIQTYEIIVAPTDNTRTHMIFGCTGMYNTQRTEINLGVKDVRVMYGNQGNKLYVYLNGINELYYKRTFKITPTQFFIDNIEQDSPGFDNLSTDSQYNIPFIFAQNAYAKTIYGKCRIYGFKITEGNVLVQDLRPCLDTKGVPCMYDEISKKYFYNKGTGTFKHKKTLRDFQPVLDSNNVPCLLDKINNKFYYNKGTGNFAYGGVQTPKDGYTEVEYIESNGTQYIDTEVVPNSNTDINMTCKACDYSDEVNISNSYIMNGLKIDSNKYNYNNTATESQPNLVASTGATLTMGSKNLAYLTDDEKEQAINNGWSLL